jgi:hypothetical protein
MTVLLSGRKWNKGDIKKNTVNTNNQCISPLTLWVRTPRCILYNICDKVCEWLSVGRLFSPGTPVSTTNRIVESDVFEFNNLQFLSQNDNSFKASCVDTTRPCQLAFHQTQSYTNLVLWRTVSPSTAYIEIRWPTVLAKNLTRSKTLPLLTWHRA